MPRVSGARPEASAVWPDQRGRVQDHRLGEGVIGGAVSGPEPRCLKGTMPLREPPLAVRPCRAGETRPVRQDSDLSARHKRVALLPQRQPARVTGSLVLSRSARFLQARCPLTRKRSRPRKWCTDFEPARCVAVGSYCRAAAVLLSPPMTCVALPSVGPDGPGLPWAARRPAVDRVRGRSYARPM
jgi:hypothetical protein